jgi:uncharacterized membrane protein
VKGFTLFMTFSYPVALHIAIINGYRHAAVWLLLAVAAIHTLFVLVALRHKMIDLLAPAILLLALINLWMGKLSVLYLPPILMSAALFIFFGRTLLPGEESLIGRFARKIEGIGDRRSLDYARGLTWLWTLFFAAMLIESLLLARFASIETWSLFTNLINYLLMVALFLLEYLYRMIYFRRLPSVPSIRRFFNADNLRHWIED